ncbi:MAG: 16S rRNA (guanine(527)-N(7))-methyltransferase RsmG [Phenylobacterium sp.]|uniref:16S rRNA (guanine(527)-N(7))-methyltransferase RsmG n=1 Tax=Phenylobacterium sp. TaxID=1871053 RepID=UPI0027169F1C|nr:16S rRNA (guanine(527)-N(7))-methyltransferase RsmG [Phenylobacterium sp.]MDO8900270.1 16S rRNA (guanine(527)-N(7))-methyltransferase RsmG [Phenylobacterium sp.]
MSSTPTVAENAENGPEKIGPVAHSAVPHIDEAEFVRLSGASPAQIEALRVYRYLLTDWNQRMNLVGPATLPDFWGRHAWDSAQLISLAPDALTWADLGAGAGLPGIVLAIFGKGREGFEVHLVESMAKRCRFLEAVVEALDLPALIHNDRAENLSRDVDIVTARACAPMTRLLGYAKPWLTGANQALFLKGQDVAAEIEAAREAWRFEAELLPSTSDPRGRIVRLRNKIHARRS